MKETERYRDTNATEGTDDMPRLAASVNTINDAIEVSLKRGVTSKCLFNFSRALRAFEATTRQRLSTGEATAAFAQWWSSAKPLFESAEDFDEWRFAFLDTFKRTRVPLGANPLSEAIRLADSLKPPPEAMQYASRGLRRLVAVCYHLQKLARTGPFFVSVRAVAKILETSQLRVASALRSGLVEDKVLIEVEHGKPGCRRAARYRFNAPEFNQAAEPPHSNDSASSAE